ncbi:uncharacterized protein KD926_004121 [Aspergillus affinis]|uniref:uncharacterized protein n=1 Tax=Aspergillus affinis TaxID=1070780 RepID=UPI0022FE7E1F|nr:uncharacterized protein KD926_004121 [Aspergillus affinis]KAI9046283.1 hypothetical protein KD926_004121 [Aspergillus affinis]
MSSQYSKQEQFPIEVDDDDIDQSPNLADDADSEEQLEHDENDAIDRSNIIPGDGLRHAKPQTQNQYSEGPDEDDI